MTLALILESMPAHVVQVDAEHVRHKALDASVKSQVLYNSFSAVKNEPKDAPLSCLQV